MRSGVGIAGAVLLATALGGCAIQPVPGEAVIRPPGVIVRAPTYHWHWWYWPHYDVEHHYVVDQRTVIVRDHHYYPFYEETNPYVHKDHGKHKGWYKHHRDHDDDHDD